MRRHLALIAGIALALLPAAPALALLECGYAEGDTLSVDDELLREPPYHTVNPELLSTNPRFANTFFIYTSWDYTAPTAGRWGIDELRTFAHYIVDEEPGVGIDTDLAQVILDYFAVDADPGSGIAIPNSPWPGQVTRNFTIFLRDEEGYATASDDAVRLHISNASGHYGSNPWLTPEQLALDGFAHEWQHTCHTFYRRGGADPPGARERGFGVGLEFDEFCAKMSEAMFGVGREVSTYETLYTRALSAYTESYLRACSCLNPPGSDPGEGLSCMGYGNNYVHYGLFGNYLNAKFTLIENNEPVDLLSRWLRHIDTSELPDTVYLHDFDGLADLIDDSAFASQFTQAGLFGSGREGKWLELMHRYSLAKFVNFENSGADPSLVLSQWMPQDWQLIEGVLTNVNSPQYRYGLFDNKHDHWYNKIHVYPVYLSVEQGVTRLDSIVASCDIWPQECEDEINGGQWPTWARYAHSRKQIDTSTYSASYFVLNAASGNAGQLRVRLGIEPKYYCIIGNEDEPEWSEVVPRTTSNLDGMGLYYVLLGYRGLTETPNAVDYRLTELNNEGNIDILDEGYLPYLNIGSSGELVGDAFGRPNDDGTYESCMLMISTAQNALPVGDSSTKGKIIPYWLEFEVLPNEMSFTPAHITSSTTWGPDETVWVNEDIVIDTGATLTILAGTIVELAGEADSVQVFGTLNITGSPANRVEVIPTAYGGGAGTWKEVIVETGGTVSIADALLEGLGRFTLEDGIGGFTLTDCEIIFGDADVVAGIQANPQQTQTMTLDGCTIWNAVTLELAGASMQGCDVHQRLSGLGDHPLVLVDRGATSILGTSVRFLRLGVDTQPQASKSGFTVDLLVDSGAVFYGLADENVTGVSLQLGCDAEIRSSAIASGITTGVEVGLGASLILRDSQLSATELCILASRGSNVNLGVLLGDPPYDIDDPGGNLIQSSGFDCHAVWAGDSCIGTQARPEYAIRVFNRNTQPVWALGNFWGRCICEEEYFEGSTVIWADSVLAIEGEVCCTDPGDPNGGGHSLVAGPAAQEEETGEYILTPNPVFSGECTITRLDAGWAQTVKGAAVFDVLGRRVRSLRLEHRGGGPAIVWDGRADSGHRAPAGVYFIRVSEQSRDIVFKVVTLR